MTQEYGVPTTVRFEKGQDINGACGQLVVATNAKGGRPKGVSAMRDIEDLAARA